MAKKVAKKRSATKTVPSRKSSPSSLRQRSASDPYMGPSSDRIKESFAKGKTVTLESFRSLIDWS